MNFVRQNSQEAVVQNPDVPSEQQEIVMQEAAGSVQTGIQQIYQQQGAAGVKQLFQSAAQGQTNSSQVQHLTSNFTDNITSKLGLSKGAAGALAAAIIPMLLRRMTQQNTPGADNGFSMGGLLSSILGGSNKTGGTGTGGGMLGKLGASLGLDKDGDGDTDLNDLMSLFGKK